MAKKNPNILILFTDEHRYDTINRAGYPHMITPNLDRLADEGCLFINGHSTNPVCMPARHDMITGLPATSHGYFFNANKPIKDYGLPTLPRIFSEKDYRTAAIGKMHFYPSRMHHGFNELYLMEELPVCRQDDQYATYLEKEGLSNIQNIHGIRPLVYFIPQYSQMDEAHHGNTWVADRTIQWLEENNDKPFFLVSSWIYPHVPVALPEEFQGLYREAKLPEPVPVSRIAPWSTETSDLHGDREPAEVNRKLREAYFAAITMVDKNIGRVLDYLQQNRTLDNTLVIFTSDHGEMLGDKGYYSKSLPYDPSVRIPFIVRYPEKFSGGKVCEDFVDLFDIFPTCLELCGLSYPLNRNLPGESIFAKAPKKDRKHQVSVHGDGERRWIMCRNSRYKYVYWYANGYEEMFDMVMDPQELVNLMESDGCPSVVYKELHNLAIEHEMYWGPEWTIACGELVKIPVKHEIDIFDCAKYTKGLNLQFQYFDESGKKARGKRFRKELEHALHDSSISIIPPDEIFGGEGIREDFMEKWQEYGGSIPIEDIFSKK